LSRWTGYFEKILLGTYGGDADTLKVLGDAMLRTCGNLSKASSQRVNQICCSLIPQIEMFRDQLDTWAFGFMINFLDRKQISLSPDVSRLVYARPTKLHEFMDIDIYIKNITTCPLTGFQESIPGDFLSDPGQIAVLFAYFGNLITWLGKGRLQLGVLMLMFCGFETLLQRVIEAFPVWQEAVGGTEIEDPGIWIVSGLFIEDAECTLILKWLSVTIEFLTNLKERNFLPQRYLDQLRRLKSFFPGRLA
jgi:hypothetical protein